MTEQLLKIKQQPFDYQFLKDLFRDYRYPRNKISKLLSSGEIIALKSGLYVLPERFGRELSLEQTANLLYGPSYISLDYALSRYGLIPEAVHSVTSVCIGRKKVFETAIGRFQYNQLKPDYYSLAYQRMNTGSCPYLMATAEKAICDKLYLAAPLVDARAIESFLFEDLRLAEGAMRKMDQNLIVHLAEVSGKHNLKLLKEIMR